MANIFVGYTPQFDLFLNPVLNIFSVTFVYFEGERVKSLFRFRIKEDDFILLI